jgi:hypothetical protein
LDEWDRFFLNNTTSKLTGKYVFLLINKIFLNIVRGNSPTEKISNSPLTFYPTTEEAEVMSLGAM